MALADLQAATARLSTDAAARRRLQEDPTAFSREASLTPGELRALQEGAEALENFARSLLNKRTREAASAMPQTVGCLGDDFRALFHTFAEESPVARDPGLDALAFLRWLRRRPAIALAARDTARYEQAALRFRRSDRWLAMGIFRFRGQSRRTCVALWWRLGGSCCYWQWPK